MNSEIRRIFTREKTLITINQFVMQAANTVRSAKRPIGITGSLARFFST